MPEPPTTFDDPEAVDDDEVDETTDARDSEALRGRGLVGVGRTADLRGGDAAIEYNRLVVCIRCIMTATEQKERI